MFAGSLDGEVTDVLRGVYNAKVRIINPSRNNHVSVANEAQNAAAIPAWRRSIMVEYLDDLEINVCRRVNALRRVTGHFPRD